MNPSELTQLEKAIEATRTEEMSRARTRGYVIRCDGEHAVVCASIAQNSTDKENYWAVGQLVSIKVGLNRIVGLTCNVDIPETRWHQNDENEVRSPRCESPCSGHRVRGCHDH